MTEYAKKESWNLNIPFKNGYGLKNIAFTHWTIAYALTLEG